MSNHKITFTLRQHTPMIHFQHDQPGATLRATELKPKLDRFLRPLLGGSAEEALPYRVRIRYDRNNQIDYPKTYVKRGERGYKASYFAGKASIEHTKNPVIIFHSFDHKIIKAIQSEFPRFLAFENFGTRQSKGFGSYHLASTTQKEFENLLATHPYPVYRLNKEAGNGKQALNIVDEFYKEIKSGLNYRHRDLYRKSKLFLYMCDHKTGWEKRKLKESFPEIIHGEHRPVECDSQPKNYLYIRALLGLAELYEYRVGGGKKIKISSTEKIIEGNKTKPKYQRLRSPITFKIFEGTIYILQSRIYEEILGKSFDFTLGGKTISLNVPDSFNLNDFLQFLESEMSITPLAKAKR